MVVAVKWDEMAVKRDREGIVVVADAVGSWQREARCASTGISSVELDRIFFSGSKGCREAKLICAGCPVREACLEDALAVESETNLLRSRMIHGVRGGLTVEERKDVLRREVMVA